MYLIPLVCLKGPIPRQVLLAAYCGELRSLIGPKLASLLHRTLFSSPAKGSALQPGENVTRCYSASGVLLQEQLHAAACTHFARHSTSISPCSMGKWLELDRLLSPGM